MQIQYRKKMAKKSVYRYLVALLLCRAFASAFAAEPEPAEAKEKKLHRCIGLATVFSRAAMHRDIERSPQEAWQLDLSNGEWGPISADERKKIINQVYFDRAFAGIPSNLMRNAVMDLCMETPKKFEPLK